MNKVINNFSELPRNKSVLLYGAGLSGFYVYRKIKEVRKDIKVIGFIDDAKDGHIEGEKIYRLNQIQQLKYDFILITTIYVDNVIKKLNQNNIKKFLILSSELIDIYSKKSLESDFLNSYYDVLKIEIQSILNYLNISGIDPKNVINEVETFNIIWDIIESLLNVDLKRIIENKIGKKVKILAIYPCANYIDKLYPILKKQFKKIYLIDDYRKDNIEKNKILHSNYLKEIKDIDAFFISTRIKELKDYLVNTRNLGNNYVWINDIVIDILKNKDLSIKEKNQVDNIINDIKKSENPLIIFGGKYYNNFTPILKLLERAGFDIFIIARIPEVSHTSPNPAFHNIPFKNKYILNIRDFLYFSENIPKGKVIIHSEAFLNPQFEGFKTLCSYLYLLIFLKKIKQEKILFLYDLIKPFYRNFKYEEQFLKIYKECLFNADKIVLNSNTKEAISFLRNSIQLKSPSISFYRYNFKVSHKKQKLNDGFHIVMVGGFLDDVGDEMRTLSNNVKDILRQNIHIHYYANPIGAQIFYKNLSDREKKYFHLEKTIMDQKKLVNEISKYHAGWMVHNTQKISDMISRAESQFFKDILFIFLITTVPSSILLFGSAGLPMFINRSMVGIMNEFPNEFFIPIELSEIKNLKNIIENEDWSFRYQTIKNKKKYFTIEYNINFFKKFLE